MPREIFRPKSDLADGRVAYDDARPNHVMRCRAKREARRDADRTRGCEHRDARAALALRDHVIERAAHALGELRDALDALVMPFIARPLAKDRVQRLADKLARWRFRELCEACIFSDEARHE